MSPDEARLLDALLANGYVRWSPDRRAYVLTDEGEAFLKQKLYRYGDPE